MVRLKVATLLKQRGWSRYRLTKETGLPLSSAYRLAEGDGQFGRLDAETLDRLCTAFKVQPGELIEWVPGPKRGTAAGARSRQSSKNVR
jgi:DNA-binding Xre family transcriptional regulator